ncbi:acyltransferase family protein [Loigolactobacillus iwatensis]|uniref:acyltransferase family protein n=1 Tax=Loigolactobacillus iwatensis TaxID=1267156 RepID=UPI0013DE43C6|nr:acyltransferase family protein [Loigolactobacillus iwatensis]
MINDQIVGNQDNATVIQENSKVKRRVEWIDIARWIGITLIIISHTIMYENWYYFQNVLFMVHVPIFFFLSGYLYHNKTWRKRLSGILSTLILPYLVVGFIAIVMAWFVGHIGGFGIFKTPYDTHNAIKAVFLGFGSSQVLFNTNHIEPAIGAVWFLLGLAWGDFFFAIYLKLALKVKSIWGSVSFWIVLWGLAAGIAIFGFKLRPHGLLPLSLNAGLVAPLFMIFGYTLKQNGRWFDFTLKWPVSLVCWVFGYMRHVLALWP